MKREDKSEKSTFSVQLDCEARYELETIAKAMRRKPGAAVRELIHIAFLEIQHGEDARDVLKTLETDYDIHH